MKTMYFDLQVCEDSAIFLICEFGKTQLYALICEFVKTICFDLRVCEDYML